MRNLTSIFFFFLALFFISSCEKSELEGSIAAYPLDLQYTFDGKVVQLSWTEASMSDFESYHLLRSSKPIADDASPLSLLEIAQFKDANSTTFSDTVSAFEDFFYYKIYAKRSKRFLASPTIQIKLPVAIIRGLNPSLFAVDTLHDGLIAMDSQNDSIFRYNILTGQKEYASGIVVGFQGFTRVLHLGDAGQGPEIFASSPQKKNIYILDVETLALKDSLMFNSVPQAVAALGTGFIAIIYNNKISVLNRQTKVLVDTENYFSSLSSSVVATLAAQNGTDMYLFVHNSGEATRFTISASGEITKQKAIGTNGIATLTNFALSPDGSQIICDDQATVINTESFVLKPNFNLFSAGLFRANAAIFSQNGQHIRISDPILSQEAIINFATSQALSTPTSSGLFFNIHYLPYKEQGLLIGQRFGLPSGALETLVIPFPF